MSDFEMMKIVFRNNQHVIDGPAFNYFKQRSDGWAMLGFREPVTNTIQMGLGEPIEHPLRAFSGFETVWHFNVKGELLSIHAYQTTLRLENLKKPDQPKHNEPKRIG